MTYFADLSPYTYRSGADIVSLRPGPPPFREIQNTAPRINIGWLGRFHGRRVGRVPNDTLDALLLVIASQMVNMTRGTHGCHLCPDTEYGATRLEWNGRTVSMGNGEIRVPAADGSLFAAPTLIGHYIAVHRYLPPAAFTHALDDYSHAAPDNLALGRIPTTPLSAAAAAAAAAFDLRLERTMRSAAGDRPPSRPAEDAEHSHR